MDTGLQQFNSMVRLILICCFSFGSVSCGGGSSGTGIVDFVVSGSVANNDGSAVARAVMSVREVLNPDDDNSEVLELGRAETDESGEFAIAIEARAGAFIGMELTVAGVSTVNPVGVIPSNTTEVSMQLELDNENSVERWDVEQHLAESTNSSLAAGS